jgi:hypothetical protein
VLEEDDGGTEGLVGIGAGVHVVSIIQLDEVVSERHSVLSLDSGDILLDYDLEHPHELLVTAKLQLQLHRQHPLQLHETVLSQLDAHNGCLPERRRPDQTSSQYLIDLDQSIPIAKEIMSLINP